ncbi:Uncharacterised protein [Mycobacteroides abscessus subsp. bolletii]|uniref:hypothetical protein n=1 Tax=Mycobacteroides abscessus TaxID=36809 RepID=UPI00092628E6|nr:hypothetical protein [Mycobacteroides abscessus]SHQ35955.1 Uncharacterised protein [Mycobacteroides abscessus subsp. bolletii]SHS10616.1 Uncharacterised protein [Mycobacteroides abscessus subsp. bolletii]SHS80531.1 Uncharacterised protein [Mycobacteroides abscessus subsp. bolletii]SHS84257.1 Uncharacterised protein [Mycobacteroides abscessus subsp. bolletii]SHX73772.1 Uncharacterised protein [Mycobacteroides abscessus subsp. bolletii]
MSKAPVSDRIGVESAPEGEGVDNFDWLDAVGNHPDMDLTDQLAAFEFIGAKTELTDEELDQAQAKLVRLGFLVPMSGRRFRFDIPAPERRAA